MLKHSHEADKSRFLQHMQVGIPSKVTLGGRDKVQVLEDCYLTDAPLDEAEELLEKTQQHADDLVSFRPRLL